LPAYTLDPNATLRGKEVFTMKAVKKTKAAVARKVSKAPAKKTGKGR
jgi:hypothetical protein